MTSTMVNNRPSTPFNWADDDEDDFDFDFESWKATIDSSAPTVANLGPLQLTPAETVVAFTTMKVANEPAPRTVVIQIPIDHSSLLEPDYHKSMYHDAQIWRAVQEQSSDAPAYPGLSHYEDGITVLEERVQYTSNWNRYKVDEGFDGRKTMLFQQSRLRTVDFAYEEAMLDDSGVIDNELVDDDIAALEEFREVDIDELHVANWEQFSEVDVDDLYITAREQFRDVDLNDLSDATSTNTWEESGEDEIGDDYKVVVRVPHIVNALIRLPSSIVIDAQASPSDLSLDAQDPNVRDEGYHSASPPVSPTLESFESQMISMADTRQFELKSVSSSRRLNADSDFSLATLLRFREQLASSARHEDTLNEDFDVSTSSSTSPSYSDDDANEIGIANEGPQEATDIASTPSAILHSAPEAMSSPDLAYTNSNPTLGDYINGAI